MHDTCFNHKKVSVFGRQEWITNSTLQWRHNELDGVSNHQPRDCLLYSTIYSRADQRKHQSSASLAFVWGIHRWPVNSPHKGSVTRKMFPFDDVIIKNYGEPLRSQNLVILSSGSCADWFDWCKLACQHLVYWATSTTGCDDNAKLMLLEL